MQPQQSSGNLILAIVLSTAILFGWQYFYAEPMREQMEAQQAAEEAKALAELADTAPIALDEELRAEAGSAFKDAPKKRVVEESPRAEIYSERLHGSIALRGARFDALTLADYFQTTAREKEVQLLNKTTSELPYFVEFGWIGKDAQTPVPNARSIWNASNGKLSADNPITLNWKSGEGLNYTQKVEVDENYLFTVTMTVQNNTAQEKTLFPYGLINRAYVDHGNEFFILHEGPLGVLDQTLEEISYESLRNDESVTFKNAKGWAGLTDKYWLTALLPPQDERFSTTYQYYQRDGRDRYQIDMRGGSINVPAGGQQSYTMRFFAGAKEVVLLDQYGAELNLPLFDRAVDFGILYFMTKPIFELLTWFHALVGNFGLAIMALTVLIKLIMFPLANKSYVAMSQMKLLMPKIQELRERHKDEPMKMNQEMMALYRAEKVNPMSGCLPILVQLPVFFALYKVLFVTIEMRQTPFYGWITDLSAPDPTNVFTLFGMVEWGAPSFMHIGLWPVLMCITMVLQQKLNPKPTDPVQATVIGWMPYIFLFLFATFPAGLVIYWTWNNTLSIAQQWVIMQRYKKRTGK